MHIIQQENPYKSTKGRVFADDDEDDGSITSRSVRLGFRCLEGIVGHSQRLLRCLLRSSSRFEDQTPGHFTSRWEDEEKGWKKESVKPEPNFFLTSTVTSVHDKYASQLSLITADIRTVKPLLCFPTCARLILDPRPGGNQNQLQSPTRERLKRSLEIGKPSPLTCTLENKTDLRYPNRQAFTHIVVILENLLN